MTSRTIDETGRDEFKRPKHKYLTSADTLQAGDEYGHSDGRWVRTAQVGQKAVGLYRRAIENNADPIPER